MSTVQEIERAIEKLSEEEVAEIRAWLWDRDDWSADSDAVPGLLKLFAHTGAFQLESGSRDAVGVPRLAPGAYTVVCTPGGNSAGGNALVEVYVLP